MDNAANPAQIKLDRFLPVFDVYIHDNLLPVFQEPRQSHFSKVSFIVNHDGRSLPFVLLLSR
jgi:hypothetical protein